MSEFVKPTAEEQTVQLEVLKRKLMRQEINKKAGDHLSISGTIADSVQFLLYEVGKLAVKLNNSGTHDDVKKAALPLSRLLSDFVDSVDSGDLQLPYKIKPDFMDDVKHRANAVAEVLSDN